MPIKLNVTITTVHSVYAARDAGIYIKFIGDSGESELIRLKHKHGWHNAPLLRAWEKDPIDTIWDVYTVYKMRNDINKRGNEEEGQQTFKIQLADEFALNRIRKLVIGYDHSRFVDGWLIGEITLTDSTGDKLYFHGPNTYGDWHDGKLMLTATVDTKTHETILRHRFVMGPILGYRGSSDTGDYQLCCLVATEGDDETLAPLYYNVTQTMSGKHVIAEGYTDTLLSPLAAYGKYKLWRYDWEVPRHQSIDYVCKYVLPDNRPFVCHVPSSTAFPRIAFATCAGLETQEEVRTTDDSNIMWVHMRNEHESKPFHLLLMGGDTVYADPIYKDIQKERKDKGIKEDDITDLKEEAKIKYFELYISRWRQPEQACMMANIPTLMMWDDHDIFDGWGSFHKVTPYMKEVYEAARENFILFQLKGLRYDAAIPPGSNIKIRRNDLTWLHPPSNATRNPMHDKGPFSYMVTFGEICIVVLDIRSQREIDQVMSEDSWLEFIDLLKILRGFKHILLSVTIPLVYAKFSSILSLVQNSPIKVVKDLEDDIIDHWDSPHHDYERKRMFKILLDFCKESDTRLTVLSGDVHVGCWGRMQSDSGVTIDFVTSSAIVNKPPPAIKVMFDICTDDDEFYLPKHGKVKVWLDEVDAEHATKRLVDAQNFLILDPEKSDTTENGEFTGRYKALYVKKRGSNFEESTPAKLIMRKPKKFGRKIEWRATSSD